MQARGVAVGPAAGVAEAEAVALRSGLGRRGRVAEPVATIVVTRAESSRLRAMAVRAGSRSRRRSAAEAPPAPEAFAFANPDGSVSARLAASVESRVERVAAPADR